MWISREKIKNKKKNEDIGSPSVPLPSSFSLLPPYPSCFFSLTLSCCSSVSLCFSIPLSFFFSRFVSFSPHLVPTLTLSLLYPPFLFFSLFLSLSPYFPPPFLSPVLSFLLFLPLSYPVHPLFFPLPLSLFHYLALSSPFYYLL